MPIASRTPEGWPNRCPVCGADLWIDPSVPPGDAPCPQCGQLIWFDDIRRRVIEVIARELHCPPSEIATNAWIYQLGKDSLQVAEIIMALEEDFGESFINEAEFARVRTVGQLVKYIIRRLSRER